MDKLSQSIMTALNGSAMCDDCLVERVGATRSWVSVYCKDRLKREIVRHKHYSCPICENGGRERKIVNELRHSFVLAEAQKIENELIALLNCVEKLRMYDILNAEETSIMTRRIDAWKMKRASG